MDPNRGQFDRSDPASAQGDAEETTPTSALIRLLTWLSPSFPIGAYSFSHGLEWAIEDRTVSDANDLRGWLTGILRHGAGKTDAIFLAHAWRAVTDRNWSRLIEVAELAAAFQPSRERRLESLTQGEAFLTAIRRSWPASDIDAGLAELSERPVAYAVAVGIAAAAHGIPLRPALTAYLHAFVSNLVSAGVRLVPLGQTEGQQAIAALSGLVEELAREAASAGLTDIGGATFRADIASMKHETQYTRLFRS